MSEWRETEYGKIPSNWSFINASDYCEKVADGTHDSPKQQVTGNHLITSKHIKGRDIDFENAYLISNEDYEKINQRSEVNQWDVLISMIGEYCGFAYLERNKEINYAVKNVGIFKNGNKDKAFWLYYYIQSKIGNNYLQNSRSGTSQPYITLGTLRKLPILVPNNIKEQKAIAAVLSSLDDKIDLLHRQNKTLEAMAETLFKQWFVVEASEDWEEKELKDILEFVVDNRGKTAPTSEIGIPLIATNCIKNNNIFPTYEKVRYVDDETYLNWFRAHPLPGDIIFVNKGTPGCVNLVPNPVDFCIAQDMIALRVNKDFVSNYYLFLYFRSDDVQNQIMNSSVGTTIPHLKKTDLLKFNIFIPNIEQLTNFDEMVEPFFKKINKNALQIRTLETLRDNLLPKLMSGEVRVKLA